MRKRLKKRLVAVNYYTFIFMCCVNSVRLVFNFSDLISKRTANLELLLNKEYKILCWLD